MVSGVGENSCRPAVAARQLPITRMAHKTAIIVLAARDMPAEGCRSAALDRRRHLQLAKADMAALALRHAGPWSRKISGTSRTRRRMTVEVYAGGLASPGFWVRRSSGLMTSRMVFVRLRLCRNPAGVSAGRDRHGFLRPLMRADLRPQSRPNALKERNPPISRKMIPITETSPHKPGRASTRSRQAASGRS
jgi:hypothetical protein